MKSIDPILIGARWIVGVDFTDALPEGGEITAGAVSIIVDDELSEAADESPEAMIDSAVDYDNGIVAVTIKPETAAHYIMTFTATLSDGQIDPEQVALEVKAINR